MGWLLLVCLLLMTACFYILDGKDVSSPSFLSCAVFAISTFFYCLKAERWGVELRFSTVLIIVTALIVFRLGGVFHLRFGGMPLGECNKLPDIQYALPISTVICFTIVNSFALFMIYRRAMQIGANTSGTEFLLMNIRTALGSGKYSWGLVISILREGCYAIGYTCIATFVHNLMCSNVKGRFKQNAYLLVPVVPMLLAMVWSTGRTGFIRVMIVCFVVGLTIFQRRGKLKLHKFLKVGLLTFVVLLIVFMRLGDLTGKSKIFSPLTTVSIYVGSSIATFNEYLKSPESFSNVFAGETLYGVRGLLATVFPSVESTPVALPFTYMAYGENSNVYTAFRRYINDFGLMGLYVIQLLKGMIYGTWYRNIKVKNESGLSLLLYAYFMYDIFMQSIEENFLREFLTIAQVFIVVAFYIIHQLFIKKHTIEISPKEGE